MTQTTNCISEVAVIPEILLAHFESLRNAINFCKNLGKFPLILIAHYICNFNDLQRRGF